MNLKLRTRITLFVILILTLCVVCLTFFSVANSQRIFGAIAYPDDMYTAESAHEYPNDMYTAESAYEYTDDIYTAESAHEYTVDSGETSYFERAKEYPSVTLAEPFYTTHSVQFASEDSIGDLGEEFEIRISVIEAQQGFRYWQIIAMFFVIIIGAVGTNFFMKRALRPLTQLSSTIEQIDGGRMDVSFSTPLVNDEVGSLTKSFQSMMGRIQNAFDTQKNFAESAAHELKTPLATMKSSLQVLLMDQNPTQEDFEESMNLQIDQIDRLTGIIDQLLQITDASVQLDQEVDVAETVLKSIEKAYDIMGDKDLTITADLEEIKIRSNQILISCITDNLLSNAVKYSDRGTISVSLQKKDGAVIFSVADEGIGIGEKDMSRLFDAFYRSDEVKLKQVSGNGLGLRIVKAAAEKIGGEISVESTIGEGSQFTVRIPVLTAVFK